MGIYYPNQPRYFTNSGVERFHGNPIVRYLLDAGPFDLNQLSVVPGFDNEDWAQFAQLIGYSVSGWEELSYVTDERHRRLQVSEGDTAEKAFAKGFEAGLNQAKELIDLQLMGHFDER